MKCLRSQKPHFPPMSDFFPSSSQSQNSHSNLQHTSNNLDFHNPNNPTFQSIAIPTKENIRQLRQKLSKVQQALSFLGSQSDNSDLRSKIQLLKTEIGRLVSTIDSQLKQLSSLESTV